MALREAGDEENRDVLSVIRGRLSKDFLALMALRSRLFPLHLAEQMNAIFAKPHLTAKTGKLSQQIGQRRHLVLSSMQSRLSR
jgi:hypothetical protein